MDGTNSLLKEMMHSIGRPIDHLKIIDGSGIFTIFLTKGTPLDELARMEKDVRLEIIRKEYFEFREKFRQIRVDICQFLNRGGYHSEARFKQDEEGNFVIIGRVISGDSIFEAIGTLSRTDITNLLNKWKTPDTTFHMYAEDVVSKTDFLSFKVYTKTEDGKVYFSRNFKVIPHPCGKIEYLIDETSYEYETNNVVEKIALLGETLSAWFKLGVGYGEEVQAV
jgi:hypothetical protein